MRTRIIIQGILWIVIYLFLTLSPLLILLISPRPQGREFWREFSVALGFAGLAMMALQFVLTARFKWLKAPYGSDIVYHFHRQISLIAFILIIAHKVILLIFSPDTLQLLNPITAPWRARAAVAALVLLIVMIAASIWRKRFKIDYTPWRIWHGILATLVVILAMIHVILVGHYINTPFKQALWTSGGLFWVMTLVWVRVVKPILILRSPYEVAEVISERANSYTLVAKPVGHQGMKFQPGQFAWLTAWSTPFADTEHPFSLSSSAEHPDRVALTIKEFGDFTQRIKELEVGQKIFLDGPYGAFSIDRHPHAIGFVFIAGGVGITPMMSMMRTMADRGDQRPVVLIYANKDWENVIFREQIDQLKDRLNLQVVHVLESPAEGWQGESGYVSREILERHLPNPFERNQWEIFICGPEPMMNAVERSLTNLGVWWGDFHSERFNLV
ncbi:MAG: ferric reductase-like transmembrane domain-containing protein [Anaerolineales bacterium]|nr:ferric reductase-like transmembrane domain-containing protein [Anaerolineales bacterium]